MLAVTGFFLRGSQADFTMFYDSGRAWNDGRRAYDAAYANLNTPLVVAAILGPLARLTYRAAQLVWWCASVVSLAVSLRLIARELSLSRLDVLCLLAALAVTYPWFLLWFGGQVTFLLMLPFTASWLALRRSAHLQAGLWFGIVVALKPLFAVMALVLPLRVCAAAAAASAGVSGAALLWTGIGPWQDWVALGRDVAWLSWADNASLWGVAARAASGELGGGRPGDLPPLALAGLALIAAIGGARVRRMSEIDRRMAMAVIWMLLVSPLGWVYYAPIALGPVRAWWPGTAAAWIAVALLAVPLPLIYPLMSNHVALATLGSVYAAALVAAWIALESTRPGSVVPQETGARV